MKTEILLSGTFQIHFLEKMLKESDVFSNTGYPYSGYSGSKTGLEIINKKYFLIYFFKDGSVDTGRDSAIVKIYNNIDFTTVYSTKINTTISQNIFPNITRDIYDFHLFLGTKSGCDCIINFGKNRHLLTLDISSNILANNFNNIGQINAISFGQPYDSIIDLSDNLNNLVFGIIGTSNYIFTTNNGGKLWDSKLYYPQTRGTTGVYVGQNTKFGDITNSHTYDISGFYIQTNSKPWIGYNGFLVADNNNNYDVSFNPNNNPELNPLLYSNNYWEPNTLSLYDISNTNIDIFENNYKVFISNLENTTNKSNLKYQQNDFVFNQTSFGLENILYKKNSDYNIWQKIDVTPINKRFNFSNLSSNIFKSIVPVDISKVILHIEGYSSDYNISGFYTLSRSPPRPSLVVKYPVLLTELTRVELEIRLDENTTIDDLDGSNDTVSFTNNAGSFLYGIKTIFEYKELDVEEPVWLEIIRTTGLNNYKITSNIFEQGKRYIFRAKLQNIY